nr:hypothetical protein CFP56_64930 [Quercus suber]
MWIGGKVNGGEENSPWVDRCGGWIGGCDLRKSMVRSCDLWVSWCGTVISGVKLRSLGFSVWNDDLRFNAIISLTLISSLHFRILLCSCTERSASCSPIFYIPSASLPCKK